MDRAGWLRRGKARHRHARLGPRLRRRAAAHRVGHAGGRAGAIYGEHPPPVNATRPPGHWQAYDIVFRRPHFKADGSLERPARMTVFLNGVLIQDNFELVGPTANKARPPYTAHPDKLPLKLQDHGNPVRYRNIWIRELPEPAP